MAIRVYKPTTAGRRNASVSDFSELTRSTPEKSLVRKLSNCLLYTSDAADEL